MKKILLALAGCCLFFTGCSEKTLKNEKLKDYLVNESRFDSFRFKSDNTYSFDKHLYDNDNAVRFKGTYSVSEDVITFNDAEPFELQDRITRPASILHWEMEIPGSYKVDLNKNGIYKKGALISVKTGKPVVWSDNTATPDGGAVIEFNGVKCIRPGSKKFPARYIQLLENLKLRSMPSADAGIINVDGITLPFDVSKALMPQDPEIETRYGYIVRGTGNRTSEPAGTVSYILAKTVRQDTVGDLTAPWYLIETKDYYIEDESSYSGQSDPDYLYCVDGNLINKHRKLAWIFGGYVKEITDDEYGIACEESMPVLKKALNGMGMKLEILYLE